MNVFTVDFVLLYGMVILTLKIVVMRVSGLFITVLALIAERKSSMFASSMMRRLKKVTSALICEVVIN